MRDEKEGIGRKKKGVRKRREKTRESGDCLVEESSVKQRESVKERENEGDKKGNFGQVGRESGVKGGEERLVEEGLVEEGSRKRNSAGIVNEAGNSCRDSGVRSKEGRESGSSKGVGRGDQDGRKRVKEQSEFLSGKKRRTSGVKEKGLVKSSRMRC